MPTFRDPFSYTGGMDDLINEKKSWESIEKASDHESILRDMSRGKKRARMSLCYKRKFPICNGFECGTLSSSADPSRRF